MIDFRCTCGYLFSVPEDAAGTSLQCPECMLLADVPLLSDLANLNDDGTIKVEELQLKSEPDRIKELRRVYLPGRTDDSGEEIDLRNTMEDYENAGAEDVPLELKDEVRPGAPKYDPVTGELIEPLRLKSDNDPRRVIPIDDGKPKPIAYSREAAFATRVRMSGIPAALFKPGSLVVLLVMYGVHLFNLGIWITLGLGLFFAAFVAMMAYMVMFSHLGNVVEDMGPNDKDELPTPMRGMGFGEDIWYPFVHFTGSLFLCYGPAFLLFRGEGPLMIPSLALAALGTLMFPAVFLTMCTSGTVYNLRPDRVFAVMGISIADYVVSVAMWICCAGVYFAALFTTSQFAYGMGKVFGSPVKIILPPYISFPLLAVGIYLMHYFCWHLALIYRKHHEKFPWILQRHISTRPPLVRKKRGPHIPRARKAAAPVEPKPVQPLKVEPLNHPQDGGPQARFA